MLGADDGASGGKAEIPREIRLLFQGVRMLEELAFGLHAENLLLTLHGERKRPGPQSRFLWKSRPLSQRALEDLNLWPSDS